VANVISSETSYAVIGLDRAAASVRLLVARPSWAFGGPVRLQHDERFTGLPGTPTTGGHLRQRSGDPSVMKINKFESPFVPGSTVWRPPV
jgi:hypothetical protein